MKTKLFSLFIAVFLISFSGKSQCFSNSTPPVQVPCITLIGTGNGGWTNTAETEMLTADGITYTLVDKVLTDGELKFREGKCWTGECSTVVPAVTNPYGWGPTDADFAIDGGWPSGTNAVPVDGGKNIQSKAGSWTITFNRLAGTWSFVPGTPLPVIKLVGTAVSTPGGAVLTTANGVLFTAKKVTLVPGTCKFDIDGTSYGSSVAPGFPTGKASDPAGSITVATTGIDYDVTFDYSNGDYTFTVATFPQIAIIGGATVGGWPPSPQPDGYTDPVDSRMTTTDGITYTIANFPLKSDNFKFRQDNSWNSNWGGGGFPTGSGSNDIPAVAGNYNGTFNRITGVYAFTLNTIAIVGDGADGWPPYPQPVGYTDPTGSVMSTTDGINYTLSAFVIKNGNVKFRQNNDWNPSWGGGGFPSGSGGNDIPTNAGTYNITLNRTTGVYNFVSALAVNKFDAASFKAYPNPTRSSWNIVSGSDDITSVQVFDVLGKAVYTKFGATKEVNVNASELSKGVYFAKVATANGESTLKLVKE